MSTQYKQKLDKLRALRGALTDLMPFTSVVSGKVTNRNVLIDRSAFKIEDEESNYAAL